MDPVHLILTALQAGLSTGGNGSTGDDELMRSHAALRTAVAETLNGVPGAGQALAGFTDDPDRWRAVLDSYLRMAGAGSDGTLVAVAGAVMGRFDAEGTRHGRYAVQVVDGKGVQVGAGNTQTNYFGTPEEERQRIVELAVHGSQLCDVYTVSFNYANRNVYTHSLMEILTAGRLITEIGKQRDLRQAALSEYRRLRGLAYVVVRTPRCKAALTEICNALDEVVATDELVFAGGWANAREQALRPRFQATVAAAREALTRAEALAVDPG
ncbi:hypothetical protein ACFVHW_01265 [Streptomyces sp. NPDC127110]|uniref:hypothetical protein n=1 Tax=Streptomyces sp. NPDC127110 TaxID=3345362 RepID=UPI00363099A9